MKATDSTGKMVISRLVEQFYKVAQTSSSPSDALQGMLAGTYGAAERREPGSLYAQVMKRAMDLLKNGVPPEELSVTLRSEGL
jgi:hypothetical protein